MLDKTDKHRKRGDFLKKVSYYGIYSRLISTKK